MGLVLLSNAWLVLGTSIAKSPSATTSPSSSSVAQNNEVAVSITPSTSNKPAVAAHAEATALTLATIPTSTLSAKKTPTSTRMTFQGGPVLHSPVIQPLYWGHQNTGNIISLIQPKLDLFYSEIVTSSYVNMTEYGVQGSSFKTSYFYEADNGAVLDDVLDIQPWLQQLATTGIIQPTSNTYYPIYVRVNTISSGNLNSCSDFCYYRNSVAAGKTKTIYYAVFPIFSNGCPACSPISTIANLVLNSAMALASAATNPDAGAGRVAYADTVSGSGVGEYCTRVQEQQGLAEVQTGRSERWFVLPGLWSDRLGGCTADFRAVLQGVGEVIGAPSGGVST
ncbi:hypothetical protein BC830DRAFT_1170135 [Chytriomyces sp. MP71]|nr:hypothetical protein BC830DRAFT_1170135 [Chytriomyces sp. MP71]